MATDRSLDAYRAFIVPDPRISADTYSTSLSTVTQAGPLPGIPEPQQETGLVLRAYGAQAASSELRIETLEGGYPGPDGATFAWKNQGDTLWRGWDAPDAISDVEFVNYSTTTDKWFVHDACVDHAGIVYVATVEDDQKVVIHKRLTATLWADYDVFDHGSVYGDPAAVAIMVLPQRNADDPGRLVCFYQVYSAIPYVRMSYSDDQGVTWTQGAARCSPDNWAGKVWRMRALSYQGSVVLLAHVEAIAPDDEIRQWVSTDDGAHFREIDATTTTNHGLPSMVVSGGRLYAGWVKETGAATDYRGYVASIGAPGEPLFSAAAGLVEDTGGTVREWATEAGGTINRGEFVLLADDDGTLWVYQQDVAGTFGLTLFRSADGGATWTQADNVVSLLDASTTLRNVAAVRQLSRVGLFSNATTTGTTSDDSILGLWLGGYATVTRPTQTAFPGWGAQERWSRDWLPLDLPEDTGPMWTAGGAGSPTVSMTSGGVRVQHSDALMNRQWQADLSGSLTAGGPMEGTFKVVAGTGYLQVQISDGVSVSYTAAIDITPTAITLVDKVSAATIATVSTTVGASGVTVRLDVGGSKVRAWYRAADSDPDREFIAIGSSNALTDGGSATRRAYMGTRVGGAAADVYIRRASLRVGGWSNTTANWYNGQTNPDSLQGRAYAAVPTFVGAAGLKVEAADGPTMPGDTWHIDTRYEHGTELLDWRVEPSPDRGWRATGDGTAIEHVWSLASGTNGSRLLGPAMAVVVLGGNWSAGSIKGLNAAGTWITIATIDAGDQMDGLTFTRENDTLLVGSGSASAEMYFLQNQLEGCYAFTDDGAGGLAQYRIAANSEGTWADATLKRPRLYVEGVVNATDPTSGTVRIVARDHITIVQDVAKYRAFKVVIDVQPTYEGYLKAGTILIGHVHYLGLPYSFGRIRAVEANTDVYTGRSGRRRVKVRGTPRRSVTFDFGDWIVARQVQSAAPSPDYVLGATSGAEPVASRADAIQSLVGLYTHCRGAEVPLVYVERLPKAASAATVTRINNPTRFIYGRWASAMRYEHRRGDEGYTESNTSAPMTIEEEK